MRSSLRGVLFWLVLCVGGGSLMGLLTAGGDDPWFQSLIKPSFNPPSWVFAPVWTTLYVLMAIAAWLVWRRGGWRRQWPALTMFSVQLALNFAWSFLFFNLRRIDWALSDVILLWFMIVLTIRWFAPIHRTAAWLMAPYLLWVSFATMLNLAFVRLN